MKLLYIDGKSYAEQGIRQAFSELGFAYDILDRKLLIDEAEENLNERINDIYLKNGFDVVFSYGFIPLIAKLCQNLGVQYYSWVYDNMRDIEDLTPILNSCCEVFFFDKVQASEFAMAGVNAHYLPLAASSYVFDNILENDNKNMFAKENIKGDISDNADISVVYEKNDSIYSTLKGQIEAYLWGYLEGIITAQSKLYGAYIIPGLVSEELVQAVNSSCKNIASYKFMDKPEFELMLADEISRKDVDKIISLLAPGFKVSAHSIDNMNPATYVKNKININVTHKSIQSGITQNVLDTMVCGGFLLTNYQPDIAECLLPGEACIMYESMEDMKEKAFYYMAHESERRRIAFRGRELVCDEFTYKKRIREMFEN